MMIAVLQNLVDMNHNLILWIGGFSFLFFVATLILMPIVIINIPEDYFSHKNRIKQTGKHWFIRLLIIVLKNLFGYIFILIGIAMIFLPGQGLLTIFVGIFMIDFPLKYRFECWFINHHFILNSINWIRKKAHKSKIIL